MKNTLSFILVIAIILVGVMTCPQKEAHKDALMKLVDSALDSELYKRANTEEEKGFAMIGSFLGSGIAEIFLDKKLLVDNYFVLSVGRIVFEGEEKIVSVGLFNHVFTEDEKALKERLKDIQ